VQFVQLPAAIVGVGEDVGDVVVGPPGVVVVLGIAAAGGGETQYAALRTRLWQSLWEVRYEIEETKGGRTK
jgi:hypothetical protein